MYWFSDGDKVLYVGKAKDLKKRVASYKRQTGLSNRIKQMTQQANHLQFQELSSELEALIVEAELIQTHQPSFNIQLKDDKSALYVLISDGEFPTVSTIRKKDYLMTNPTGTVIGPFRSAFRVLEVLKIIRPIFPWCSHPEYRKQNRPCFYRHLNLCPGVCTNEILSQEYLTNITHLTQFLKGKSRDVVKELQLQMHQASQNLEYEQAATLRDKIELIKQVTSPSYKLKPDLTLPQLNTSLQQEGLAQLRRLLRRYINLPRTFELHRIEGYDVSNTQGTLAAVAQVVFIEGKSAPSEYRLFNIKTLNTPNDYAMMQEAIQRRQNHLHDWGIPDLLVIDGGKGQLRAALKVWHQPRPVISIAKNPDRVIIPRLQLGEIADQIPKGIQYAVLKLPANHPALRLIQQIRDEAHRFSKKQHTRRRDKI